LPERTVDPALESEVGADMEQDMEQPVEKAMEMDRGRG